MEGLGINLPTLVAQIINFAILFGVLYLVAYKPVMGMLDERSRKIKESMEQTELAKEQAERAEEEAAKRIQAAAREGQEMVAKAVKDGEGARGRAQEEARQEADAIMGRARAQIANERDKAIAELRKEFAGLTIMAAGKVIDRSLDKKAHRELIDEVLKESESLKKG